MIYGPLLSGPAPSCATVALMFREEVLDAARAAQVITAVMVQRVIAQANQPIRNGPLWGFETPQVVREGLSYNELRGFRSVHNSLTDEEFEELAGNDTDGPMTRSQLQEISQEKRALALEPENEASKNEVSEMNSGFLSDEEDGLEGSVSGLGRRGPGPALRRSAKRRRTCPGCWRIRCGRGRP